MKVLENIRAALKGRRCRDTAEKGALDACAGDEFGAQAMNADAETVSVELDISPDYKLTALMPKVTRKIEPLANRDSGPRLPTLKISEVERRDRVRKVLRNLSDH